MVSALKANGNALDFLRSNYNVSRHKIVSFVHDPHMLVSSLTKLTSAL